MANKYTFEDMQYANKDILRNIENDLRKALDEIHQKRFAQIGRILFLQEELRKMEEETNDGQRSKKS